MKQEAAEAEVEVFKDDLGPFVVAAETTRMPMVFTNATASGSPIIFANQAYLNLTGYQEDEVLGVAFADMIEDGCGSEALTEIQTAFEGGRDLQTPVRYRSKSGGALWVTVFISPVRNEAGAVVQHFSSFVDVTRHRDEEDRLRFLLKELNHRTQNTLATVQAVATQSLREITQRDVVDAFKARIVALGKAHSLLGSKDWKELSLRKVLCVMLGPFGIDDHQAQVFRTEGDDVILHSKAALSLAMVFHELATNAVKHGALSNDPLGQIEIAWHVEDLLQDGRMVLRWKERGGPPVKPPGKRGFGSRLIERGLAQELNGEVSLSFEPTGVVCEIAMPIGPQLKTS